MEASLVVRTTLDGDVDWAMTVVKLSRTLWAADLQFIGYEHAYFIPLAQ